MSRSGFRIRSPREGDLPDIARIQQDAPEAAAWAPRDYLRYAALVAETESGELVGLVLFRDVAPQEREILNLAVAPKARRLGAGRMLLDAVLEGWKGAVFLEVRHGNSGAQQFYANYGFYPAGIRKNYYPDTREDAVVLRFQSC